MDAINRAMIMVHTFLTTPLPSKDDDERGGGVTLETLLWLAAVLVIVAAVVALVRAFIISKVPA